jgi:DnaK suppressor protein
MDAMQGQAMSLEVNRRRQVELNRIEVALQRLARDEYGDCIRCGEVVESKRLEFDPSILLCIDCANAAQS